MKITPTKNGGRIVEGDTRNGKFRVEWDADGVQISESMEIREPDTGPKRTAQACAHGGEVVDRVKCRPCSGSVQIKVYGCEVHGRCTVKRRVEGVTGRCSTCRDLHSTHRTSAIPTPSPTERLPLN